MNDTRRLLITFEPAFGNVDMVRAAVRGICADFFKLACNAASIMDFCIIVTELLNNAVEHSSAKVLDIELILSDHEAVFRLISEGNGFDPTVTAVMPSLEPEDDLPEGGYGLALIQSLADGMEYERRENWNMVTLRKVFPGKEH
ncbi:MAG: ATP-binding protein [Desulfuromonadaceae bacterium]|nr:ATP-binding protein [Desulfuromonadaceae bacterium]